MNDSFFEKPILNSPYEYPSSHWELNDDGLPTQNIINTRRKAAFITPVPKPKKRRDSKSEELFDESMRLGAGCEPFADLRALGIRRICRCV